jgi:hypothetical protein
VHRWRCAYSSIDLVNDMTKKQLNECVAIINTVLNLLGGAVPSNTIGAQLRADVGSLQANAAEQLQDGTAADALNTCFADAVAAGTTLSSMQGVLGQINLIVPVSSQAILLLQLCVVLCLSYMSNIIASMSFTDRDSVDLLLLQLGPVFDAAAESAADVAAADVYMAIINMQASVVQYLVQTEQPLPMLVQYKIRRSLPSLVLAMRLYADPTDVESLADGLVAENLVVNPCFMPYSGIALSAP